MFYSSNRTPLCTPTGGQDLPTIRILCPFRKIITGSFLLSFMEIYIKFFLGSSLGLEGKAEAAIQYATSWKTFIKISMNEYFSFLVPFIRDVGAVVTTGD